jgi:hypothetical protein
MNKMGLVAEEFCIGWLLLFEWCCKVIILTLRLSSNPKLPNAIAKEMNTDNANPMVSEISRLRD